MRFPPKLAMASAIVLFAGVATLACGSGASGSGDPPEDAPKVIAITPDLIEFGRETYARNCAPCHGPNGRGDGPSAATLNPAPRDHTNAEYMARLTDKKIADTIKMGGLISGYPNMPSNPHLKPEQIEALVAFVRRLSNPQAESIDLTGF